jgi:hypothetical protein
LSVVDLIVTGGILERAAAMANHCLDAHDAALRSPARWSASMRSSGS